MFIYEYIMLIKKGGNKLFIFSVNNIDWGLQGWFYDSCALGVIDISIAKTDSFRRCRVRNSWSSAAAKYLTASRIVDENQDF